MKNVLFLLLISPLFASSQSELNVITFNIRYNNPGDSLNAWPHRIDKVASQIVFHQAHIVGVQEALNGQLADMQQQLPHFNFAGMGRDGDTKGEYSAIFFDTTRLQVLQSQTFWLSETPGITGHKGWDAAYPRIVTWAKMEDRLTKKIFYVFNTHFDHRGKLARKQSAMLLLQKVNEIAGSTPSIITGDFNAQPDEEPIQLIIEESNPLHLVDSKSVSLQPHYGPEGTFNGFQAKETSNQPIDYIFIKGNIRVLQHATLSQSWEGRFSSDHFPVFARVVL